MYVTLRVRRPPTVVQAPVLTSLSASAFAIFFANSESRANAVSNTLSGRACATTSAAMTCSAGGATIGSGGGEPSSSSSSPSSSTASSASSSSSAVWRTAGPSSCSGVNGSSDRCIVSSGDPHKTSLQYTSIVRVYSNALASVSGRVTNVRSSARPVDSGSPPTSFTDVPLGEPGCCAPASAGSPCAGADVTGMVPALVVMRPNEMEWRCGSSLDMPEPAPLARADGRSL
mmetsp:Transcript_20273/g.60227  ORF Transcript_20273/g.60227 Transcript_20273/m.60227 type:complete len:230 (-) Transcript_20273:353-1042(-)